MACMSFEREPLSSEVYLHVLGIARCSVLLVSSYVDFRSGSDRDILIIGSISCSDLRALGIKSNGNLTPLLDLLSLTGIVNYGLVIIVRPMAEVHYGRISTAIRII